MNAEELLEYCLKKAGAYLDLPFGPKPVCCKVKGKIFAEVYPDEADWTVTLKCEPMRADFYRQTYPGSVARGYHCPPSQQPHRNTIYPERLDDAFVREMVDHS